MPLDALGSPPVQGAGAIDDHSSDALLTAAWLRRVHTDSDLLAPPQPHARSRAHRGLDFWCAFSGGLPPCYLGAFLPPCRFAT